MNIFPSLPEEKPRNRIQTIDAALGSFSCLALSTRTLMGTDLIKSLSRPPARASLGMGPAGTQLLFLCLPYMLVKMRKGDPGLQEDTSLILAKNKREIVTKLKVY